MKAHSWKGIGALFIGILAFINTASIANSDELGLKLESALQFAEEPLANLAEEVLSSSNQFVDYSNTSGEWNIKNSSTWCSGFVPGLFLVYVRSYWRHHLVATCTSLDQRCSFSLHSR